MSAENVIKDDREKPLDCYIEWIEYDEKDEE